MYTNNNPLVHLSTAVLNATEMRWAARLAAYDIEIRFRKGSQNKVADAFSRYPAREMNQVGVRQVLNEALNSTPVSNEPSRTGEVEKAPVVRGLNTESASVVLPSYSSSQLREFQQADVVLGHVIRLRGSG